MAYPAFPYHKLEEMASFDQDYIQELKKLYTKFFKEFPEHYEECVLKNPSKEKLATLDHKHKPSIAYLDLEILAKEIKKGRELLDNSPTKTQELAKTHQEITNICHFYYNELTK